MNKTALATKTNRYLPRHPHYLADTLLLIRQLQALARPLNFHIALGGGVLNHGYSDKDIDLYVLPRYPGIEPTNESGQHDYSALLAAFTKVLGAPVKDYHADLLAAAERYPGLHVGADGAPWTAFMHSLHYETGLMNVDIFIVRA